MKKYNTRFWIVALLFVSFNLFAKYPATVIRVIDGDTVVVITEQKKKIRIRLIDIDAPELGQPFAKKSRQHLSSLIANKQVIIQESGKDTFNRKLATIFYCEDNINELMVKKGYAWAYRYNKIASNPEMVKFERQAKQKKLGLWQDKKPIEPWEYRQIQKNLHNVIK